ncbi:MAG: TRAP transporter small permease [Acetivibrionales bacterium]|jgi:TRAP-type C4-dicarboxylate transport system permease small subunit
MNSKKSLLEKLMDFCETIMNNVIFILFLTLIVSSFAQVVFRRVFNASLTWSEELARYTGIWMIMMSTAIGFKHREHIAIDFFVGKLKAGKRKLVTVINDMISVIVMMFFTYYSFVLLLKTKAVPSPAMRIPMGFVYTGVVIGGFFSVVFIITALIKLIKSPIEQLDSKTVGGE